MTRSTPASGSRQAGFSLAELLVALGLAGVVLAVLVGFFTDFSRASALQQASAGAQQSARAALDYMLQDLRMAGFDPLTRAGAGIEEISTSGRKLRFTADRCDQPPGSEGCPRPRPDGDLDDAGERVTYFYDAAQGSLLRCLYEDTASWGSDAVSGSCQRLLDRVVANPDHLPLFVFLDEEGAQITNNAERDRIRSVVITLNVAEPGGAGRTVSRTYASRLRFRNIGL
ncbi:MAG: prepilin-type N-terminal cleavage/methylation domain-containing protein [Desulfobacterales bacterium]